MARDGRPCRPNCRRPQAAVRTVAASTANADRQCAAPSKPSMGKADSAHTRCDGGSRRSHVFGLSYAFAPRGVSDWPCAATARGTRRTRRNAIHSTSRDQHSEGFDRVGSKAQGRSVTNSPGNLQRSPSPSPRVPPLAAATTCIPLLCI